MQKLGLFTSELEIEQMIKAEDKDGSGEVDFDEFSKLVERAQTTDEATGMASVIQRKANTLGQLKFRSDRCGLGIELEDGCDAVSRKAADGWGVQLLDPWLSKLSRDKASVIVDFSRLAGPCFIGVVSKNYEHGSWDTSFDKEPHAVGVETSTGKTYVKGVEQPYSRLCEVKSGHRVQLELDMHNQQMELRVIGRDGDLLSSAQLDNIPVEVAVAVALGPSTGAAAEAHKIQLVGSSTEKTSGRARRTSKDLWDDDNIQVLSSVGPAA